MDKPVPSVRPVREVFQRGSSRRSAETGVPPLLLPPAHCLRFSLPPHAVKLVVQAAAGGDTGDHGGEREKDR